MAYDAKTERLLSLKKLSGKAHTSNIKGLSNEALPSGVTIAAASVFGQAIPASPNSSSLYTITDTVVEYVRLSASFIQGSDTGAGQHGFSLTLPDDYESNSSNPKKGSGFYVNGGEINVSKGGLQLVPPSFGNSYEAKLYHTSSNTETRIPLLDARDWNLDYFNGIVFQQDPPGTGFHSEIPAYVDAFIYIGDYVGSMLGSSSPGDLGASYLVLTNTGSLNSERALVAGAGLTLIDGGAGSSATLKVNDGVVATLTGSVFSGAVKFEGGLAGSLTSLADGTPYLRGQDNIQITTSSDGYVTIAAPDLTIDGFDREAQFLVLSATGSMANERIFTAGTGIEVADGGAGNAFTVGIDNGVVATISGSTFTGPVKFNQGLSGSLTKIESGLSYLVAGPNVTIASASNGQVTISSSAADIAAASFVTFGASEDLSNERVITAGRGIGIDTTVANQVKLHADRQKVNFNVTGPQSAGSSIAIPGVDFSLGSYADKHIDIFINGVLMTSGSSEDYTLTGNTNGLTVNFALTYDDKITVLIQ